MKVLHKTSRTAGYLERIWRKLNEKYFDGKLDEPVLTLMSTKSSYGHITVGRVWRRGEEHRHELNIGAGTLDRPIEDVVTTLLHECVHLYCIAEGIQDTSRNGAYHNKRFKIEAEKRDLEISYDKRIGWSITRPGEGLLTWVLEENLTEIDMNRQEWFFAPRGGPGTGSAGTLPPTSTTTSNSRKYVCPSCGLIVRATKEVRVSCMDCNEPMVWVQK